MSVICAACLSEDDGSGLRFPRERAAGRIYAFASEPQVSALFPDRRFHTRDPLRLCKRKTCILKLLEARETKARRQFSRNQPRAKRQNSGVPEPVMHMKRRHLAVQQSSSTAQQSSTAVQHTTAVEMQHAPQRTARTTT